MQFDILYEEILKQMQFDFNNTPKYNIKSWMDMVDINVKQKYFKIKNMKSNPKGQRIAFLKFWNQLILGGSLKPNLYSPSN